MPRIGVPSTTNKGSVSRFKRTATRNAAIRRLPETPRPSSSENKSPIFLGNSYGMASEIKNAGANGGRLLRFSTVAQPTMSALVSENTIQFRKANPVLRGHRRRITSGYDDPDRARRQICDRRVQCLATRIEFSTCGMVKPYVKAIDKPKHPVVDIPLGSRCL